MGAPSGKPVTIVGAGFSGLVSAFYLTRAGYRVRIVERDAKPGGLIRTISTKDGLVETAANGLLANSEVEALFEEIGLEAQATRREARKRFIFRDGRFRRWPLGLKSSLRVASFVARFLFFKSSVNPKADESVAAWGDRVLGSEASRYLLQAALQGIYAGDPARMSAALILGRFFEPGKSRRGKLRGTIAPRDGMGALILALENYLKSRGVEIEYSKNFSFQGVAAQPTVLAVSHRQAAALLDETSAEMLPVVTATAFFENTHEKSRGFGALFPPVDRRKALGVLKNDFIFEGRARNLHSETWILGGAIAPEVLQLNDDQIIDRIRGERVSVFGSNEAPKASVITRWPEALPHYTAELRETLAKWKSPDNVFLIGNYLGAIGLSQIVLKAKALPEEIASRGRWQ